MLNFKRKDSLITQHAKIDLPHALGMSYIIDAAHFNHHLYNCEHLDPKLSKNWITIELLCLEPILESGPIMMYKPVEENIFFNGHAKVQADKHALWFQTCKSF
jgi:hypothetical protein